MAAPKPPSWRSKPSRPAKTSALAIVATIAVLVVLGAASVLSHNWVYYFDSPPTHDLTPGQRQTLLRSALRDKGLKALSGTDLVTLKREDIEEVVRSHCVGELQCTERRSSRHSLLLEPRCRATEANLYCAYQVVRPDGAPAVGLLHTGRGRSWLPISEADPDKPAWSLDIVSIRPLDDANVRKRLCSMGYCSPADLERWRVPKLASADPRAEVRRTCRGIVSEIVGSGVVCLKPDDPAARSFQDCRQGVCGPKMIALAAGRYQRGITEDELKALARDFPSDRGLGRNEHPPVDVTIGYALAVSAGEITFDDWMACHRDGRCRRPTDEPGGALNGRHPVSNVSWEDVTRGYLPWLNGKLGLAGAEAYRLLSDAEWEYAARAGGATRYGSGDQLPRTAAHYADQPESRSRPTTTVEVGSLEPNAFGLHDMHGNVAEWVDDCLTFESDARDKLPRDGGAKLRDVFGKLCASDDKRVIRGGSFASSGADVRSASRKIDYGYARSPTVGFRIARTLDGQQGQGDLAPAALPTFR
jgi:formylglycine-generating enzyme required for sulfatase activity